jgi:predicted nucleic acid-binding protein
MTIMTSLKPVPNPGVVAWLAQVDEDRVFISVVTLAELRYGVERLPAGARRHRLDAWVNDELPTRFEGRVLPINATVADTWGRLVRRHDTAGRPIGAVDAFIAATARVHRLTIVTRNVSDFQLSVGPIMNPWTEEGTSSRQ